MKKILFTPFSIFLPFFLFMSACNHNTKVDEPITKEPSQNIVTAAEPDPAKAIDIVIETSVGTIEAELYPDVAPMSVENFLSYVDDRFYDGTIFHRVIKGFMIQTGGFDTDHQQKPTKAPIKNEADNGLKNTQGTLAMARTGQVDSATSQFFINAADNTFLNHGTRDFGYAVFGKVTKGLDIVKAIESVETSQAPLPDNPVEQVIITSIKRAGK